MSTMHVGSHEGGKLAADRFKVTKKNIRGRCEHNFTLFVNTSFLDKSSSLLNHSWLLRFSRKKASRKILDGGIISNLLCHFISGNQFIW